MAGIGSAVSLRVEDADFWFCRWLLGWRSLLPDAAGVLLVGLAGPLDGSDGRLHLFTVKRCGLSPRRAECLSPSFLACASRQK